MIIESAGGVDYGQRGCRGTAVAVRRTSTSMFLAFVDPQDT